jgi:hypothetical protein
MQPSANVTSGRTGAPVHAAGAERLLRHLHAQGVPFCLATSSHQRHYELKTTQHTELFSLFRHRITGAVIRPSGAVNGPQLPSWPGLQEADLLQMHSTLLQVTRSQMASRRLKYS